MKRPRDWADALGWILLGFLIVALSGEVLACRLQGCTP